MSAKVFDEQQIIGYLLGNLSEADQTRIEERFFKDAEYRELIRSVEDDLIDDYVRGELSAREREQFEKYFSASPVRRHKVELARALAQTLTPSVEAGIAATATTAARPRARAPWAWIADLLRAPHPAFSAALIAATLLLMVGGLWLLAETVRLRGQLEQLQAERGSRRQQEDQLQRQIAEQRARSENLAGQLEREREERARSEESAAQQLQREREQLKRLQQQTDKGASPRPAIASFVLSPGLVRGSDEPTRLVIPRGTGRLRLRLDLERGDDYQSYRAELRTAGGGLVWSRDMLRARPAAAGRAVVLNLPTSLLTSGEYELTLKGVVSKGMFEDLGYYYFSILKR